MQILHIEDNKGDRVLVSSLLRNYLPEWKVLQFESIAKAQTSLQNPQSEKQIILLDLGLPPYFGLGALIELVNWNLDQPIVVLTGTNNPKLGIEALKLGAQDYLEKNKLLGDQLKRAIEYSWERFDLNQQLVAAIHTKDRLFSIIGHDLRSPLAGILSLVEFIKGEGPEIQRDDLNNYLDLIHKSTLKANNLLVNLLYWSRLQLNKLPFEPKELSVKDSIDEVLDVLGSNLNAKGINLVLNFNSKDIIVADPKMLACIIRNLLSNAIKFSHHNGTIIISGESLESDYVLSIQDFGIGIPEKMLENLFSGITTVGRQGTAGEASTGLGLMLAQGFSKRHGGSIDVKSRNAEGSTFSLKLPLMYIKN